MAWRGAASRTVLAAVRRPAPSAARGLRAPPIAAPPRRLPPAFANSSSSPLAAARPLAAMMGSPLTAAAVLARLTAHPAASARACCELSQGSWNEKYLKEKHGMKILALGVLFMANIAKGMGKMVDIGGRAA